VEWEGGGGGGGGGGWLMGGNRCLVWSGVVLCGLLFYCTIVKYCTK